MIAHLGLLNDKIAHVKYSFQIKSIPLWNIPFRYFWTYQLSYEFDNWLLNPYKKYWNLVECKKKTSNKIQCILQLCLFVSEYHQKIVVRFFVTNLQKQSEACFNPKHSLHFQALKIEFLFLFYLKSGIYCIIWSLFFLIAGSKKNNN